MKKILSLMLTLAMLLSAVCAPALAAMPNFTVGPDGRVYVVRDTTPAPTQAPTPAPTEAPTQAPAAMEAPADAPAAPAAEATEAPAAEAPAAPAAPAAQTVGLAKVTGVAPLYTDKAMRSPVGLMPANAVVLVIDQEGYACHILFALDGALAEGYMDESSLKLLKDSEAETYRASLTNQAVYSAKYGESLMSVKFMGTGKVDTVSGDAAPVVTKAPAPASTEAPAEEPAEEPAADEPAEAPGEARVSAGANIAEAAEGDKVIFTVTAMGLSGDEAYQWQRAKGTVYEDCGLSGAKTATLTFAATRARLDYQYRCQVTDGENVYYTDPVRVTFIEAEAEPAGEPAAPAEEPAPAEDEDPEPEVIVLANGNATVTASVSQLTASEGTKVYYTASVAGVTGSAIYQWQKSADGVSGWSNSQQAGSKTAKMTVPGVQNLIDKYYRCVVTDDSGSSISNTVKVTWMDPPVITAEADTATAVPKQLVHFDAEVSGTAGTPKYQWQKSADGETSWAGSSQSGAKTPHMKLTATESLLSCYYRLRVIDDNGIWYSNTVKVDFMQTSVSASVSQATASKGTKVYYTAEVTDTVGDVTYQWQKSADGQTGWANSAQSGNKTAKMTITGQQSLIDLYYRCRVRDDNGYWYSDPVKVTWMDPPVITAAADREIAVAGQLVHFDAEVTGVTENAAYRWQKSADGQTGWSYSSQNGYATPHMKLTANESLLNNYYRLRVIDDNGTWYSNVVKVDFLVPAITIDASASQATASIGTKVYYNAEVTGAVGDVSYQWQKSANGQTGWSNSQQAGSKTAQMTITATQSLIDLYYRCAVTDDLGTFYSEPVKVTWMAPPTVTAAVDDASAVTDQLVRFDAEVSGTAGTPKYQWQKSADGQTNWKNSAQSGCTTPHMKLTASKSLLNCFYRLRVIDDNGIWYSNAVWVEYLEMIPEDDFLWYVKDDGTVEIDRYIGPDNAKNVVIPSIIDGKRVTGIGVSAFSGCSSLTGSLVIPEGITSIGQKAFYNCSGLTGSLNIPGSVTSIGIEAFYNCYGFTGSLVIPSGVTDISNSAFYNCYGFNGGLTIPAGVTSIGYNAFYGCNHFTGKLTIPNSVTSIGNAAFRNCDGFTGSLIIPGSVTTIGQYAFNDCDGFNGGLTISSGVQSIGLDAFQGCEHFRGSLFIPGSVTTIGAGAFYGCTGFTGTLTISDGVKTIGYLAFYNCSGFTGSLTIPDSVTSIGSEAFRSCRGFTGSLTIPDSVTSIGDYAFSYCSGFTGTVSIPANVSVGDYAFFGCNVTVKRR